MKNTLLPDIPVIKTVDVVIVGGTTGGVGLAVELSRLGLKTLLVENRRYVGTDVCSAVRLWPTEWGKCDTPIAKAISRIDVAGRVTVSPMQVKYQLEDALLEAGVDLLYGAYPALVLKDSRGQASGVVLAHRNGFQAVKARRVIDATLEGTVARVAGLTVEPRPGPATLRWVTLGNPHPVEISGAMATVLEGITIKGEKEWEPISAIAYDFHVDALPNPSEWDAWETRVRLETWHPEVNGSSERLWAGGAWFAKKLMPLSNKGDDAIGIDPASGLMLFGPVALEDNGEAGRWINPGTWLAGATRLAPDIQRCIEQQSIAESCGALGDADCSIDTGKATVRFSENDHRSTGEVIQGLPLITQQASMKIDVLVAGGGTGGAGAAIAAAREGAKTVLTEYLHGLGGVGTLGLIGNYWFSNRVGFTAEVDREVAGLSGYNPDKPPSYWHIQTKMYWYLRSLHQAGGQVRFGVCTAAALVEGARVVGSVVAGPFGLSVINCHCAIDATGNVDLASAAGAPCVVIGAEHVAVQGSGLPPYRPGHNYRNTDWTFTDDCDLVDSTQAMITARHLFRDEYDSGQIHDTRQRRQIKGRLTLSPLDFLAERTFPDTVVTAYSNFDTHGFTIHPVFAVVPPNKKPRYADVPFRCFLPKGLDGLMATGLGLSAHRDALPVIRMQGDVQNQGYAAGLAAAMSARLGIMPGELDVRALQARLVEKGNLRKDVLEHDDSFPLSQEVIEAATNGDLDDHLSVAIMFAHPAEAVPLLIKRLNDSSADRDLRSRIAQIVGLIGRPEAAPVLAERLLGEPWDDGWNFTGMGQFGRSQSEHDSCLVALSQSGDNARAKKAVEHKMAELNADQAFSHFRAVAEASEILGEPSLAQGLARLLQLPGVRGHDWHDMLKVRRAIPNDSIDTTTRNLSLRELHLARALFRCGDHEGVGKTILEAYSTDLRGHYAKHAQAVLKEGLKFSGLR